MATTGPGTAPHGDLVQALQLLSEYMDEVLALRVDILERALELQQWLPEVPDLNGGAAEERDRSIRHVAPAYATLASSYLHRQLVQSREARKVLQNAAPAAEDKITALLQFAFRLISNIGPRSQRDAERFAECLGKDRAYLVLSTGPHDKPTEARFTHYLPPELKEHLAIP